MSRICTLFAVLFISLPAVMKADGGPAGIFLYCLHDQNMFVLVAEDSSGERGWSGFGGGADAGESTKQTAARETSEETRGFFSSEWLQEKIQDQKPFNSNGFSLYFAEVPFVPAQRINNQPLPKGVVSSSKEMSNYCWIPVSDLDKVLRTKSLKVNPLFLPKNRMSDSYWQIWINGLVRLEQAEALPWRK